LNRYVSWPAQAVSLALAAGLIPLREHSHGAKKVLLVGSFAA